MFLNLKIWPKSQFFHKYRVIARPRQCDRSTVMLTATKMGLTRWSQAQNTLMCSPCDQHHSIANTCDYHLSITVLDCHLTNIIQKRPCFPSLDHHLTNIAFFASCLLLPCLSPDQHVSFWPKNVPCPPPDQQIQKKHPLTNPWLTNPEKLEGKSNSAWVGRRKSRTIVQPKKGC